MQIKYLKFRIKNIIQENKLVKSFILDGGLAAVPGQYVMVWRPGENEKPFSIACADPLTLTIANVGPFTKTIHAMRAGEQMVFRGAYGRGYSLQGSRWLLVGGGYGMVPLYFLAQTIPPAKRKNCTVVIGAKSRDFLIFENKFKKLGCSVEIATDDGSRGYRGWVTDLADGLMAERKPHVVYSCGPEIMLSKIAHSCTRHKIPCQVSLERRFKCGGMGLCGECCVNGRLACTEGPVFPGLILLKD